MPMLQNLITVMFTTVLIINNFACDLSKRGEEAKNRRHGCLTICCGFGWLHEGYKSKKDPGGECDQVAMDVLLKMQVKIWIPGIRDGKPQKFLIPFRLNLNYKT